MSQGLSRKLTFFSFVFAIIVVLGHLIDIPSEDILATKIFLRAISNLVAIAMGYFLFVSGYLFFNHFDMSMLLTKWKTRVRSLLIPFIIWNAIGYVVMWKVDLLNGRQVWQCFWDVNNLADGPLWYVLCIMVYMILTPAIYYLVRRKVIFWITWLIAIAINIIFNLDQGNLYLYAFPFYLMGAGVALNYQERFVAFADNTDEKKGKTSTWLFAVFIFLVATTVLLAFFYDVQADYHKYSHFLNRLVAPVVVFGCFRNCKVKREYPILKSSFFIYCGHEILIAFCMDRYLVRTFLYSWDWMFLSIAGMMCLATGVIGSLLVVYCLLHRFCPKVCAVLSGGR